MGNHYHSPLLINRHFDNFIGGASQDTSPIATFITAAKRLFLQPLHPLRFVLIFDLTLLLLPSYL